MKAIRDKLKIVNEGKGKDVRVKAKSAGGSILVQNHAGNFVRINSIKQFYNMYRVYFIYFDGYALSNLYIYLLIATSFTVKSFSYLNEYSNQMSKCFFLPLHYTDSTTEIGL